jgi:hypothetical protein
LKHHPDAARAVLVEFMAQVPHTIPAGLLQLAS